MKYKINGKEVTKQEWDAAAGAGFEPGQAPLGTVAYSESSPLLSDGLGCMKAQVEDMRREIKRRNIQGVRCLDNGQLEITSRRGRREVCQMRGLHDNDGGYGD